MHATRIWGVATKPEQSSQSCASLPRGRAEHRALARSSAPRPVSVGVRLAASERYDPELCRRDLCCWCRRLFAADGRGRGEFLSAQGTPECESIIIYRQGETPHRPRRARQSYFVMPGWRETCWVQRPLSAVSSSPTGWRVLSLYPPAGGFVGGCQRLCRPPGSPGTRPMVSEKRPTIQ